MTPTEIAAHLTEAELAELEECDAIARGCPNYNRPIDWKARWRLSDLGCVDRFPLILPNEFTQFLTDLGRAVLAEKKT